MRRLEGKTVFAAAAAQGIGRATVERMTAEGARVIATDIDITPLSGVAELEVRQLDVTDTDAVNVTTPFFASVTKESQNKCGLQIKYSLYINHEWRFQ